MIPHPSLDPRHARTSSRSVLGCSLALLVGWHVTPAAAYDLTGVWRDENGGRYSIRQAGDEICWSFEPINVFCGTVIGDVIAGSWLDLPTGPYRFSGHLVLQVESPDRLVKVFETMKYGSSVWTREGSPPAPPRPGSDNPPGGTRLPPADEKGGLKPWDYRSIGDEYRDRIGKHIEFSCGPDPAPVEWRALYGTGTYTGDSVLCQAALHDGKITTAGGTVVVEIRPGQSSYSGSRKNGVISADYGRWDISFGFVSPTTVDYDAGGARPAQPPPPRSAGARPPLIEGGTIGLTDAAAVKLRGQIGARLRVTCPSGGSDIGYLWGTDVYTIDSLTCSAAVHAGLITFAKGGTVTLEIRPGQSAYQASARFGVASKAFGAYDASFTFVP